MFCACIHTCFFAICLYIHVLWKTSYSNKYETFRFCYSTNASWVYYLEVKSCRCFVRDMYGKLLDVFRPTRGLVQLHGQFITSAGLSSTLDLITLVTVWVETPWNPSETEISKSQIRSVVPLLDIAKQNDIIYNKEFLMPISDKQKKWFSKDNNDDIFNNV